MRAKRVPWLLELGLGVSMWATAPQGYGQAPAQSFGELPTPVGTMTSRWESLGGTHRPGASKSAPVPKSVYYNESPLYAGSQNWIGLNWPATPTYATSRATNVSAPVTVTQQTVASIQRPPAFTPTESAPVVPARPTNNLVAPSASPPAVVVSAPPPVGAAKETPAPSQAVVGRPATPAGPPTTFVDPALAGGDRFWREYDITAYTSRFASADQPELAIREWLYREFGANTWSGADVAALTVSPQLVRVYHNPAVQQRVGEILGRFLYYTPGVFRARGRLIQTKDDNWQTRYLASLGPSSTRDPTRQSWLLGQTETERLIKDLTDGIRGSVVADQAFRVANGQEAKVSYRAPKNEDRAVVLRFRPLIEADANSVEVDLNFDVDSDYQPRRATRSDSPANGLPNGRFRVPPGKTIVIGLGASKSLDGKWHFRLSSKWDVVFVLEVTPEPGNNVLAAR